MKSKILKDLQLKLFVEDLEIDDSTIILTIDDNEKTAYYRSTSNKKIELDYWYALLYF